MKRHEKNSKKFLALLLSLLMATSVTTAFAACDKTEDPTTDTETVEPEKDEEVVVEEKELITNMKFDSDTDDKTKPIITSVTGWTRSNNSPSSGSAPSSESASGVVDTAKWADLTTSGIDVAPKDLTEAQAKEKWGSMTTKDKLEYYEAWKKDDANDDRKITDLEFYESFNIDVNDLPTVEDKEGKKTPAPNPGKPETADDTNVLMINNARIMDTYIGTAQKFTSNSTVTVKAGETATFSVWVKTSNLLGSSSNNDGFDFSAYDKGAYIRVEHSVGGKKLDPLEIKNIQADDWTQYSFALCGSAFADSTFSIVLGLGQSGGTNKEEYVNGYAFFDEISCEVSSEEINVADYDETFNFDSTDKTVPANKTDDTSFVLDFSQVGDAANFETLSVSGLQGEATTEKNVSGVEYSTVEGEGTTLIPALNAPLNTTSDIKDFYNLADLEKGDDTQKSVYTKYFENKLLDANDAFLFLSKNGAAYKAKTDISIAKGYSAISFYVKTSEMKGYTGAGVKLEFANEDFATTQEIAKIDTTALNEEDTVNGWQRIMFFFNNKTDKAQDATLTLSFGPTTGLITSNKAAFYEGFAAFAKFEKTKTLSKAEFDCAVGATYTKTVVVEEPEEESQTDGGFDAAATLEQYSLEKASLTNGFAKAKNYTGLYSDNPIVGGSNLDNAATLLTAGLLNKQYETKDTSKDNYKAILEKLGGSGATWNSVIGENVTQPLIIYNETASAQSYGFVGTSNSISANAYKTVSMRVKVSNATANIYLIDTSEDNYNNPLSITRNVTYWYDRDGNVCAKDPTDSKFYAKEDIAFKLQPNGLYKVNPNWNGSVNVDQNAYFANLAAYKYDEESKNLILDDLATDYAYSEKWIHEGNDRIAFYNYNKTEKSAYAYRDNTTKVYDFSLATELTPRYEALSNAKEMHVSVADTAGEWVTVTFYIHAGESAKNYRLEVWNGARSGNVGMNADSYVMVDSWNRPNLDATTWEEMLEEKEEGATKEEGVFSFYDSAKYFRYDETLDELMVGDVYTSYDATVAKDTVIYLQSADKYTLFADYAAAETAVEKDVVEEEPEVEEEEEESNSANAWLLGGSIAIAAVLILAVVSIVVRKLVAARRKKRGVYPKKK
ncbi:MAG: hypothetical protein E7355_02140 [Clostridiales bacterium]|nr:hypothetical protein [Clostridiales bacterium]